MPIMTKMRDNMPVILMGLVVVFLFSIMFDWGMDYLGYSNTNRDVVGVVEGKKLTYQEFSNFVQQQAENQKKQSGTEPDENTIKQIREQIWNSFVVETLLEKEAEKLGVKVTDQEIVDWVRGPNPPQFLVQQFQDSLGRFNRSAYEGALNEPKNKEIWIEVEKQLRKQRLFEKIQSVVLATVRVTPGEILQKFNDQNILMNIEYAFFDPNKFVNDKDVKVEEEDLKKYFYDNQSDFKIRANRKIKYVLFNTNPSSDDSMQVFRDLEAVKKQVESGLDFIELQKSYMMNPTGVQTVKHGEMMAEKENVLFSAKVGSVVGPVKDFDGFHLIKIIAQTTSKNIFVKASHILFSDNADGEKKAKEILAKAKSGGNFSELAKTNSIEPGANASGGSLGWFGNGRMVKPFEDAAFKANVGEIIGPIKTQFGYHIIKIEGRDNRELKIASITMPIKISSQSLDQNFQKANDFSFLAKKGSFEDEAKSLGLEVVESGNFEEKGFIPGLGMNEAINRFAFKNDLGDVSDVYNLQNGMIVFKVSEIINDGVKTFESIKNEITPKVLNSLKLKKTGEIANGIASKLNKDTSISKILNFDNRITIQTTGNFNSSGSIPNLGQEPIVSKTSRSIELGKVSNVVNGNRGSYIVKVISRTNFDSSAYNLQKEFLGMNLLQEKKQRMLSDWIENLKKKSDIEDNRDLFFR